MVKELAETDHAERGVGVQVAKRRCALPIHQALHGSHELRRSACREREEVRVLYAEARARMPRLDEDCELHPNLGRRSRALRCGA